MNPTLRITAISGVAAAIGFFAWWRFYDSEEWHRREYFPLPLGDGCQLLDRTLGARARDPKALFDVLGWRFEGGPNPHNLPFPDFFDVRHQALIRLLDLQKPLFGSIVAPPPAPGLGIDHEYAVMRRRTDSRVIVEGTPTLRPTTWDSRPWEGYWHAETLEFTPEGKLLSRAAVHQ